MICVSSVERLTKEKERELARTNSVLITDIVWLSGCVGMKNGGAYFGDLLVQACSVHTSMPKPLSMSIYMYMYMCHRSLRLDIKGK